MNTDKWIDYFENHRTRSTVIPWGEPLPEHDPGYEAFRELLPQLSAGEGAEGRLGDALANKTAHNDYARCLRAYAEEEAAHGVLLAHLGQRYGVKSGTDGDLFIRLVIMLVNLGPLLLRVLMLFTGEVITVVLYQRLRQASPDRVVKAVFQTLLSDEGAHIAFHGDRLREAFRNGSTLKRWLLIVVHRLGFGLLVSILYLENRRVLKAYGREGFKSFLSDCRELRDRTSTGALSHLRSRTFSGPNLTGPSPLETLPR